MTKQAAQKFGVTILFSVIILGSARVFTGAIPKMADDGHVIMSLFFSVIAAILIVGGLAVYARIMGDDPR